MKNQSDSHIVGKRYILDADGTTGIYKKYYNNAFYFKVTQKHPYELGEDDPEINGLVGLWDCGQTYTQILKGVKP